MLTFKVLLSSLLVAGEIIIVDIRRKGEVK